MNKMVCMILIFLVTNQLIAMEVVAESAESSASVIQLLTDKQVNRAFGSLSDDQLQEDLLAIDPARSPVVHDGLMRYAIARFTSKKYLKNFEGKASIALLEEHSAQCPKIAADIAKIIKERLQSFKANHGFSIQESGLFIYQDCFSHFSHDGQLLAYLRGNAKAIDVWSVGEGWKQNTITVRKPYDFYFSPENKFLLVKKDKKTVDIFRLANDTKVNTICGKNGAAVSPDGKYVVTFDAKNVQILDIISKRVTVIEEIRDFVKVKSIHFSKDSKFLFVYIQIGCHDWYLKKFNIDTGEERELAEGDEPVSSPVNEPAQRSLAQNLMLLKAIQHAQLKWWQCYA